MLALVEQYDRVVELELEVNQTSRDVAMSSAEELENRVNALEQQAADVMNDVTALMNQVSCSTMLQLAGRTCIRQLDECQEFGGVCQSRRTSHVCSSGVGATRVHLAEL